MNFVHPDWLWLLLALPMLLALERAAARRAARAAERLAGKLDSVLLEQRLPGQHRVGIALRVLALGLLIVGAAGPEWGHELVRRSAVGSEVVLVLDVSASMDVRDVPPSRLEEARREAVAVLERLAGSRVAVVAFAGEAARLCPLTIDRSAARLVLESISTSTVAEPGTDLARGLRAAARLLPPKRRNEQLILVWTDGEDLEHNGHAAVDELARAGLRVFAIGVGTPTGDVVPVLDDQGRAVDVKRDASGGPVRSRLDQALLQTLARRTSGAYFSAARPGGELPRLLASLGGLTRDAKDGSSDRGERLVERPVPNRPRAVPARPPPTISAPCWRRRRATTKRWPSCDMRSSAIPATRKPDTITNGCCVRRSASSRRDPARRRPSRSLRSRIRAVRDSRIPIRARARRHLSRSPRSSRRRPRWEKD